MRSPSQTSSSRSRPPTGVSVLIRATSSAYCVEPLVGAVVRPGDQPVVGSGVLLGVASEALDVVRVEREVERPSSGRPARARSRASSRTACGLAVARTRPSPVDGASVSGPSAGSTRWSVDAWNVVRPASDARAITASCSADPMPWPRCSGRTPISTIARWVLSVQRHVQRGVAEHAVRVVRRRRRRPRPAGSCGRTPGRAASRGSPAPSRSKSWFPQLSSSTALIACDEPVQQPRVRGARALQRGDLAYGPRRHGAPPSAVRRPRVDPFPARFDGSDRPLA